MKLIMNLKRTCWSMIFTRQNLKTSVANGGRKRGEYGLENGTRWTHVHECKWSRENAGAMEGKRQTRTREARFLEFYDGLSEKKEEEKEKNSWPWFTFCHAGVCQLRHQSL